VKDDIMRIALLTLGLAAACMALPAIAADPPAAPAAPAKKGESKPATQATTGRTDPECPEGTNQNAGTGQVIGKDPIIVGGANKPIPKPKCEAKLQKLPTPAK
jgi:hypothetical protein